MGQEDLALNRHSRMLSAGIQCFYYEFRLEPVPSLIG